MNVEYGNIILCQIDVVGDSDLFRFSGTANEVVVLTLTDRSGFFERPFPLWAQATLENPQPDSFQSGIGVISGFVCAATLIEIEFNATATFEAAYGTSRGDTQEVCGDTNNGFSLLFNWNLLDDGQHTVRVLADGVEFALAGNKSSTERALALAMGGDQKPFCIVQQKVLCYRGVQCSK